MLYIFDWDGTLVDSAPKIVRCLEAASRKQGLPVLAEKDYQHIIGLALPTAIARLYPEESMVVREQYRQAYFEVFSADDEKSDCFDGVLPLLIELKLRGHQLAVATSKSRQGLIKQWDALELHGFFDDSRCADETESKPHPLMLNELLHALAVRREHAVMVGDTSFDLEMAQNAGIQSVGVSYGAHSIDQLLPYSPVTVADSFHEVYETLLSIAI